MDTLSAAFMLLLIMDPLGNMPVFLSVLKQVPDQRRFRVIFRELLISYVVLLAFLFWGQYILAFLQIKTESIGIAGAIVLFIMALRMIFHDKNGVMGELPDGEPFIVPLAIPFIAGPTTMAALILLSNSDPDRFYDWFAALTAAWITTTILLLSAPVLLKILTHKGLDALERLMGLLLVAIAVQMFLDAITDYFNLNEVVGL